MQIYLKPFLPLHWLNIKMFRKKLKTRFEQIRLRSVFVYFSLTKKTKQKKKKTKQNKKQNNKKTKTKKKQKNKKQKKRRYNCTILDQYQLGCCLKRNNCFHNSKWELHSVTSDLIVLQLFEHVIPKMVR